VIYIAPISLKESGRIYYNCKVLSPLITDIIRRRTEMRFRPPSWEFTALS